MRYFTASISIVFFFSFTLTVRVLSAINQSFSVWKADVLLSEFAKRQWHQGNICRDFIGFTFISIKVFLPLLPLVIYCAGASGGGSTVAQLHFCLHWLFSLLQIVEVHQEEWRTCLWWQLTLWWVFLFFFIFIN